MQDPRIDHLLNRHFDGALTFEERQEMDGYILASPAARDRFWELAHWHALIREWGEEDSHREVAPAPAPPFARSRPAPPAANLIPIPFRRWLSQPFRIAAALLIGAVLWQFVSGKVTPTGREKRSPESTLNEPAEASSKDLVAVLTQMTGVVWSPGQAPLHQGSGLPAGWLKIESGVLQIDFYSGVHLILEGPAEFEICSDNSAQCRLGKFTVHVPEQATGFTVVTPQFAIKDLGTEFACEVPRSGAPEVHVVLGKVALAFPKAAERELTQGQAARGRNGQLESIAFAPGRFVTSLQMAERVDAEARARLAKWKAGIKALSADPATLLHYTFEAQTPQDDTLRNQAARASSGTHGAIVGAQWAEGRWPTKGALEFKGEGDRVRLALPGSYQAATCLAWVRVERLPNKGNALFCAVQDGLGAVRWEITDSGGLSFSLRADKQANKPHFYGATSSTVVSPLRLGQWIHLATVYDLRAGTVAHYADGELVGTQRPERVSAMVFSRLEIGNSNHPPGLVLGWSKEPRNFVGRIDELAIVARSLSGEEIRQHYEEGKP